jgi:phage-related protein
MRWHVTFLPVAAAEFAALPADMRSRFGHVALLIEGKRLEHVHAPHVKHLDGRLWEIRMQSRDGISRAIYVTASGRRVVVVRVFMKKAEKTPQRELEIARQRAKDVI